MLLPTGQLEDELGDVLEKALRQAGLSVEEAGLRAEVAPARLRDAMDYRYDFTLAELRSLADVLGLNEVGFCALAENKYPLPKIAGLPFPLHVLRMPFGAGSVNAYVAAGTGTDGGVLFDGGADFTALRKGWPAGVTRLDAVFLTHAEGEHMGGLPQVLREYGLATYHGPRCRGCGCCELEEGAVVRAAGLMITAFRTPGHAAEHNCYLVESAAVPLGRKVLIAGDLIFAGSLGGGYFSCRQLLEQARRLLDAVPDDTVIAPGHGPLTTAGHERRFNPFIV